MRFQWDEVKNRRNRRKHKISFENAKLVFDDPSGKLADRDRMMGTMRSAGRRWE